MSSIVLPRAGGGVEEVPLAEPASLPSRAGRPSSRRAFAAAHVVAAPLTACAAQTAGGVDWEATIEERRRIWSLGLGVAEAMDTAQRGMGMTWPDIQILVDLSLAEAAAVGGQTVVGISNDNAPDGRLPLERIEEAYLEQLEFVESRGGQCVVMASRQLAASATSPDDYLKVYSAVLSAARRPVILHWLGAAFDPALAGYWGHDRPDDAADTVLDLMSAHREHVDGIKLSLLDAPFEKHLRSRMPPGMKLYTGDDFNYVDLIAGDGGQHSHALLGAFAAIAPFARAALARLDADDVDGFRQVLEPTLPLSRLVFAAPTSMYKTGIVWLAYLEGRQTHFRMIGGMESGRSISHLLDLFREANRIGLFPEPDLTAERLRRYLAVHGLG
ncbi:MAG TPA: DUF993 family protein [Intrasporangium sp.]|uniref:DUF993 family protein n=1 Tax=Intrasporangium sp. TaxID=1925024 RepID=UPI002D78F563|nr:DUF993 family protein [Intrasporangium sp.]HET7398251.1 DUF993 family protein [Intrasporangium sp.]